MRMFHKEHLLKKKKKTEKRKNKTQKAQKTERERALSQLTFLWESNANTPPPSLLPSIPGWNHKKEYLFSKRNKQSRQEGSLPQFSFLQESNVNTPHPHPQRCIPDWSHIYLFLIERRKEGSQPKLSFLGKTTWMSHRKYPQVEHWYRKKERLSPSLYHKLVP